MLTCCESVVKLCALNTVQSKTIEKIQTPEYMREYLGFGKSELLTCLVF